MRLYNVYGKLQKKNISPYLIKWDGSSRSKIQYAVKQFLKPFWKAQRVYEEFPVYGTRLKVDILNATKKIAIEVNGRQHSSFNKFFHSNSRTNYLKSIKRDIQKSEWLEKNDFMLIEIEQDEVCKISKDFFKKKFNITL
jgi:hypothetical protein|tara:strand:+ start:1697 stop:2113 length:417 start_codon:yes stop_codon:yes gene_type:complete